MKKIISEILISVLLDTECKKIRCRKNALKKADILELLATILSQIPYSYFFIFVIVTKKYSSECAKPLFYLISFNPAVLVTSVATSTGQTW